MCTSSNQLSRRRKNAAFTLIEVAMATTIIGLSVSALLVSVSAGTKTNDSGQKLTEASFLAQEMREWTCKLPFKDPSPANAANPPGLDASDNGMPNDIDDLKGQTFSPPRDASGAAIANMTGWAQKMTLTWRNPANLTATVADGASDIINVQVTVLLNNQPMLTSQWLVSKRSSP